MKNFKGLLVLTFLLAGAGVARGEGSEFNVNQEKDCYACNPETNLNQYKAPIDQAPQGDGSSQTTKACSANGTDCNQ